MTALEISKINKRVESDLVCKCLEKQRKNTLHVIQIELQQFFPIMIEESIYTSQIFEKSKHSLQQLTAFLLRGHLDTGE